MTSEGAAELKSDALHTHREPRPGKLEIAATKPLGNQRDLALAYSPGVAFACEAIAADTEEAANLTARQNLVAVLTNRAAGTPSAEKMGRALALANARSPDFEIDGEMQADTALSLAARACVTADCRLSGEANALIFPNLDAGSAALQLTRLIADALPVGPILVGPAKPAHVLTPSVTARGVVNMTAIAAAEAAGGE
jgi:malate dehydrogenase (oxaloacetate-decarboxylating)(NADP+)